jgi:hypothetical protein
LIRSADRVGAQGEPDHPSPGEVPALFSPQVLDGLWATSRAFLRLNGYTVQFEKMSSVLLMVDAADDKIDETALASWFRARLIRLSKG